MGLPSTAIKAARLLRKREAAAKLVRNKKQAKRKLNSSNNKPISPTTRYEKRQGPRRFSKGSRTKQARQDSAAVNRQNEKWDEAEHQMNRDAGTERESESFFAWQRQDESGKLFSNNLHKRSRQHPAFNAEYLKWRNLSYGG